MKVEVNCEEAAVFVIAPDTCAVVVSYQKETMAEVLEVGRAVCVNLSRQGLYVLRLALTDKDFHFTQIWERVPDVQQNK